MSFSGGAERREQPALVVARIFEQPQRLVGVCRDDNAVEAPQLVAGEAQLDAVVEPADRPHPRREVDSQPLRQRAHVRLTAAGHCLPAEAPEAEHPVIREEPDRIDEREVERPVGSRRPERRAQRNEEVVAEARRVALLGDVARQRPVLVAWIVERTASEPQEARDLERQPRERRAAARVLECVPVARDREAHLRVLGADAELAEETDEVWIGLLVVDDEAGVEPEGPACDRELDGIRVAAGAVVAFEELDVVRLRQRVRRAEAGDSRADHRDPHEWNAPPARLTFECAAGPPSAWTEMSTAA